MSSNGTGLPTPQVSQASGMVSVQAECSMENALGLMKARAAETHHTLDEIAKGVIDRSMRFNP